METMQYPSSQTIKAFGGTSATARALGLPKSTVHRWKIARSGLIPRWWTGNLQIASAQAGVVLPKPKKGKKQ